MARRRYVVRFKGQGPTPPGDVDQLRRRPDVTVVDESPKMVVIEGDDEAVSALTEELPGWIVAPEQTYHIPDTRKRLG